MKKSTSIAVLSATAASLLFTGCGEAKKIEKFLDDGEYKSAVEFYENATLNDKESEKIAANLRARMEKVLKDFAAGDANYKTAKNTVSAVIEMDIDSLSDEAVEALSKIDELNKSKENFKAAVQAEKDSDDLKAYSLYSKVIKDDGNYEQAAAKAGELLRKLLADYGKKADEYIAAGSYQSAMNQCRQLVEAAKTKETEDFYNDTKKKISTKIFKEIDELVEKHEYYSAKSAVGNALWLDFWTEDELNALTKKSAEITEAEQFYTYTQARDKYFGYAEEYVEKRDFKQAYYYVDLLSDTYGEFTEKDEDFGKLVAGIDEKLEKTVEDLIEPYMTAESYFGALEILEEAESVHELDSTKSKIESIKKISPIYLGSLEGIDISSSANRVDYTSEPYESPLGNRYLPSGASFELEGSSGSGYSSGTTGSIKFMLNGEYKRLTGVLDTLNADVTGPGEGDTQAHNDDGGYVASLSVGTGGEDDSDTTTHADNGEGQGEDAGSGATTGGSGESTEEPDAHEAESVDKEGYTSSEYGVFYVYGETTDDILYSKKLNGATLVSTVDIDVTGLDSITVAFKCESGTMSAFLYDWVLEK